MSTAAEIRRLFCGTSQDLDFQAVLVKCCDQVQGSHLIWMLPRLDETDEQEQETANEREEAHVVLEQRRQGRSEDLSSSLLEVQAGTDELQSGLMLSAPQLQLRNSEKKDK